MLTTSGAVSGVWSALLVSLLVSLATTPVAMVLATRLGAIDMPGVKGTDSERHLHTRPTPRMGGLAIYLGFFFSALLFVPMGRKMVSMLIGATIIVFLGILDDIYDLKASHKFCVQILAAAVALAGGNKITFFSRLSMDANGGNFSLGWLSVPVTLLWIVLITNAVNLIDGLDGLAAGVSSISAISLVFIALTYSNTSVAIITGALAGACIGFLPYNIAPAKIFMGDTGSTFIGYILAVASIQGLFKFYAIISFVIPFFMLGLPIFDVCYAVLLRVSHGENPMKADRKHVHYRLIDMGFSKKQTVAVLYICSAILGVTAVVITTTGLGRALVLLVALGATAAVAAWLFLNRRKK
ncbi:MAG: undecaprenyl/decaprenyl-phosphate alpha-N-acetylglucosaminyl 1-phosphate transferase [Clostridiales bacterium]|nr:undecaprenyl/decaprenyl-phosphate alpha-N-acetylglucosaminyl 1-phosphate transferase [Clostridiales bacterium]MCD8354069.1 undecaprenyl/decaprenyl-phosphate alpha-N-acetylglucosaminyl 1-phosphate transferase [Clostridiales bacterium]